MGRPRLNNPGERLLSSSSDRSQPQKPSSHIRLRSLSLIPLTTSPPSESSRSPNLDEGLHDGSILLDLATKPPLYNPQRNAPLISSTSSRLPPLWRAVSNKGDFLSPYERTPTPTSFFDSSKHVLFGVHPAANPIPTSDASKRYLNKAASFTCLSNMCGMLKSNHYLLKLKPLAGCSPEDYNAGDQGTKKRLPTDSPRRNWEATRILPAPWEASHKIRPHSQQPDFGLRLPPIRTSEREWSL